MTSAREFAILPPWQIGNGGKTNVVRARGCGLLEESINL